jgi:hypothetical protein
MKSARDTDTISLDWIHSPRVQIRPGVLFCEIGGEAVLLETGAGLYFGLNEVGCRLWQLLQREPNLLRAFDTLLREYDVPSGLLRADLEKIVLELEEHGLVDIR